MAVGSGSPQSFAVVLGTIHSRKHRVRIWSPSFVLFRGREGSTSKKQYYERHH
ncbi:hypothetical protein M404DRAFT_992464 [Pisolithus tinctorius Marx 270]|uniref:Uncharacterized protein n=1 Tax=Pisolithus tinctorius Marx 270 TaxID=870435 RepID=A0A0C3PYE6_PISTI|nr:hypothetical protein M404DRAFT_992464 [Pisolithus tinctorius Marx 270]